MAKIIKLLADMAVDAQFLWLMRPHGTVLHAIPNLNKGRWRYARALCGEYPAAGPWYRPAEHQYDERSCPACVRVMATLTHDAPKREPEDRVRV